MHQWDPPGSWWDIQIWKNRRWKTWRFFSSTMCLCSTFHSELLLIFVDPRGNEWKNECSVQWKYWTQTRGKRKHTACLCAALVLWNLRHLPYLPTYILLCAAPTPPPCFPQHRINPLGRLVSGNIWWRSFFFPFPFPIVFNAFQSNHLQIVHVKKFVSRKRHLKCQTRMVFFLCL